MTSFNFKWFRAPELLVIFLRIYFLSVVTYFLKLQLFVWVGNCILNMFHIYFKINLATPLKLHSQVCDNSGQLKAFEKWWKMLSILPLKFFSFSKFLFSNICFDFLVMEKNKNKKRSWNNLAASFFCRNFEEKYFSLYILLTDHI